MDNRINRIPYRRGRGGLGDPPPNPPTPPHQPSSPSPNHLLSPILRVFGLACRPSSSRDTDAMDVNPQTASPLFSIIPAEIRDQIFQYALTEYTKTDPKSQYPESTKYTRPGYTGHRAVTIPLLLTCRRVHLETYHLPAQTKEHVFWHERWPPSQERYTNSPRGIDQEKIYFAALTPWQLELVKGIHLFTQLFWLEDGSFFRLTQQDFMQGIEKLKITIRRGDWWWNERNAPLAINPQRGNGNPRAMQQDWEAENRGMTIPWRQDGWGCAFGNMKGIKELEIEFETSEDKVVELGKIVEKARSWQFPLKDGKFLSTQGAEPKTLKWRGPMCMWSDRCPYCHGMSDCRGTDEQCVTKRRLREQRLGPECTIMSLRWKVMHGST